jgi:hypothetical protein
MDDGRWITVYELRNPPLRPSEEGNNGNGYGLRITLSHALFPILHAVRLVSGLWFLSDY